MIGALIGKDLKLYFRNQFFTVITLLGLVLFVVLYLVMPAEPDDTLYTALYLTPKVQSQWGEFLLDSFDADLLSSEDALIQAVEDGDYSAGLVLNDEIIQAIANSEQINVPVYLAPGATPELRQAISEVFTAGLNNFRFSTENKQIKINEKVIVMGPDLLGIGQPIALRDRMLPMLLTMIFSIELIGMANLISEEVTKGTVNALLVTPLKPAQFFSAKMLMGMGLAFTEVLVLVTAIGRITVSPVILLITLLIGSLMVTGVAFFIAAFSRGFMSVMSWSVLFLLLLFLPGVSVMFPTMASDWIKSIPSYYLVDTLHRVLNYGAGWSEVAANLLILFAWSTAFLAMGGLLLRRKFR